MGKTEQRRAPNTATRQDALTREDRAAQGSKHCDLGLELDSAIRAGGKTEQRRAPNTATARYGIVHGRIVDGRPSSAGLRTLRQVLSHVIQVEMIPGRTSSAGLRTLRQPIPLESARDGSRKNE